MPLGKWIAPFLSLVLLFPPVPARAQKIQVPNYSLSAGTWPNYHIYAPLEIPEANLSDSPRLEKLASFQLSNSDSFSALACALDRCATLEHSPDVGS